MKFERFILAVASAAASVGGASTALAQATAPAATALSGPAVAMEVTTITGQVTAIDTAKRLVSLKGDDGRTAVLFLGPDIRNFENLKVGDRVTSRYTEARSLALLKGGAGSEGKVGELRVKVEAEAAKQAPPGGKPGLSAMERTTEVANVFALDRQRGTVTLRGTSGTPIEVKVPDKTLLDQIGLNDQIVIGYRHAAAISVEPVRASAQANAASGVSGASAQSK